MYLRLADGRGWVFERKPGVGVMCEPVPDTDVDREGRHFVNYSPAIFVPLLDYLGMKEMERLGEEAPLPRGPQGLQLEFDAMLRDFGILPTAGLGEVRALDSLGSPYDAVPWWAYGLAFEVRARQGAVLLTALETCAVGRDSHGSVPCTVHICEGPLEARLAQRSAWVEAGRGELVQRQPSRVEFKHSVLVRQLAPRCIYIATDIGVGCGVAFGAPMPAGVSAENADVEVLAGHFATRFDDFSEGAFYPFNGRLEYTMPP